MSKKLEERVEELEKIVKHLETEIELLNKLVSLKNNSTAVPYAPQMPWYREPTLKPPYKITCEVDK